MTDQDDARCVLRFRCPDQPGILARLAPPLVENGWDIREAAIYGDADSATFFVRMELVSTCASVRDLPYHIAPVVAEMNFDWEVHDIGRPMPVLLASCGRPRRCTSS